MLLEQLQVLFLLHSNINYLISIRFSTCKISQCVMSKARYSPIVNSCTFLREICMLSGVLVYYDTPVINYIIISADIVEDIL